MRDDFETLRETLLVLLDKTRGTTTEVIQFSTVVQIVCPWTTNTDRIIQACQRRA